MSDYQLVMHLWKTKIPHMAVELQDPDGQSRVIGFGPSIKGAPLAPGSTRRAEDITQIMSGNQTSKPIPTT